MNKEEIKAAADRAIRNSPDFYVFKGENESRVMKLFVSVLEDLEPQTEEQESEILDFLIENY